MKQAFAFKLINFLCEENEQDELHKMFQEYVKVYARLTKQPAMRHHLMKAIKMYFRIQKLEEDLDKGVQVNFKEWLAKNKLLLDMLGKWSLFLTRMGLTFTSQQYILKEDKVQSATELAELEEKLMNLGKEKQKMIRNRINKGGERRLEEGPPINIVSKKKLEAKKKELERKKKEKA